MNINMTPINRLNHFTDNNIYIKRDDMIPFSFGGNKARKAKKFYQDIISKQCDFIVTYGSDSSNHCRIIANMAASIGIGCTIISPNNNKSEKYNNKLVELFGARIVNCRVEEVKDTIDREIQKLVDLGYKPYFIQGGGHGDLGTKAYVETYEEILKYEIDNKVNFDYIFHASGTGTTQAGLICGNLINNKDKKIIGISIARKKEYGST